MNPNNKTMVQNSIHCSVQLSLVNDHGASLMNDQSETAAEGVGQQRICIRDGNRSG